MIGYWIEKKLEDWLIDIYTDLWQRQHDETLVRCRLDDLPEAIIAYVTLNSDKSLNLY